MLLPLDPHPDGRARAGVEARSLIGHPRFLSSLGDVALARRLAALSAATSPASWDGGGDIADLVAHRDELGDMLTEMCLARDARILGAWADLGPEGRTYILRGYYGLGEGG